MGISETIATRKSVRAYLDKPVNAEDIDTIVEAGRWAPNAGPYHVTVVRRAELRRRLDEATHKGMLASGNDFLQMRASLPGYRPMYEAPVAILLSAPAGPYSGMNCALVAENMVLQATELGLGSCFIVTPGLALNADAELAKEAGLPEEYGFQCAVLVGYAAADDPYSNPERLPKGAVGYVD